MQGTLVLAVLNVKSSYLRDVEKSLEGEDDIPDTLQWWIGPENAWRIKTFALDHDIHVYSVGPGSAELVELTQENNAKHYGEVIACQHILAFKDCEDAKEVRRVFKKTGLSPRLEVATGRFAFLEAGRREVQDTVQPKQ